MEVCALTEYLLRPASRRMRDSRAMSAGVFRSCWEFEVLYIEGDM